MGMTMMIGIPSRLLSKGTISIKTLNKKSTKFHTSALGACVSTSTRWALGTSGGRSGRTRCQQRQADEEKASGMSGSLQRQLLGCEYLISSRFQIFLE